MTGSITGRTRRIGAVLAAFVAVAVGSLTMTAPAEAASYGWVYISMPKWLGNCATNNGTVATIWGSTSPGGTVWNADSGDDIVYGKVALNQWNSVQFTLLCARGVASVYQPGISVSFVPTRNNQTIWVGPGGWTRN